MDEKFKTLVKERGCWICVRCKKNYSNNRRLLHASHFWGVAHSATRFDFENVDPLCYTCHYGDKKNGWEHNKAGEYRDFMIAKLGPKKYDELRRKANTVYPLRQAKIDFLNYLASFGSGTGGNDTL